MLIHYLKVALRNLLKYKANSLISLVCLAIGITCFCMTELMIKHAFGFADEYPDSDRRVIIFNVNNAEHMKLLEAQQLTAFDKLVQYWHAREGEIITVNDAQQEFPFISKYNYVSGNYFEYKNIRLQRNTLPLQAPDEVIISESFAKKAFGDVDPIGLTIRRGDDKNQQSFRIIDVALSDKFQSLDDTDVYFNISADPRAFFIVDGLLKKGININEANEELKRVHITHGERTGHPMAWPRSPSFEETLIGIGIQAIGFLILLSGLINFLKFIIQSFYNRQHELAIRKCVGSSMKGIFCLLFAEIFCMLTASAMLSFMVSETVLHYISMNMHEALKYYLPTINGDVLLMVYGMQCRLYFVLLVVCIVVALFPVYRLRRTSIIHFVTNRGRRHIFRNTMIGVQLAVSLFFLGGSLVTYQYIEDRKDKIYNPLTVEEQERVMLLEINNNYLKNNKEAIISEINRLPGICESLKMEGIRNEELKDTTGINYYMDVIYADANYAEFFHIPVQGKEISADNDQTVFISPALQEMLNRNGMYNGNLIINNQSYIIGGSIPNTYQYDAYNPFGRDIGSVWKVSHEGNMYYFRIAPHADIAETIQKMNNIIHKYAPSTLPSSLHQLTDEKFNRLAHIETTGVLATVLAVISILLVVFSIYSAISLDTQNRQKEMAIRKINGATPKDIAFLFGKSYGLMFLLAFLITYPLECYVFTQVFYVDAGSNWDWPIIVLAVMSVLIVFVTAYKIREIMHINPALILKKE